MTGPSAHLSWSELACHDGTPYPQEWRGSRATLLAEAFETVRTLVGQPIAILSAYRSPAHNRAIGGARFSQHVEGRALDLRPPTGWTVLELAAVVRDVPLVKGVGVYPTFVHMDVRPTEKRVVWSGARVMADEVVA